MTLGQLKSLSPATSEEGAGLWVGFKTGGFMPILPGALDGCKLFPVIPGDKLPALDYGWQSRATNDNATIQAWENAQANLNWAVACGPSGLFVIDVDPNGIAAWQALQEKSPELREAVAKSFTVRTPRGGFHHYFRGYGPTTASRIAEGIDTRGGYLDEATGKLKSIGYVVLPGSRLVDGPKTTAGEYQALGGDILPMSAAVLAIMPERKKGQVHGLEKTPGLDQDRNVAWATDLLTNYVNEGRVSKEGAGGNNTAFQVAASILDKAISPARCFELIDELWNPHCQPPWEDWELEQIIGNAARYGEETGKGAKGFEDNASAFAAFANYEAPEELKHMPTRRQRVQWIDDYAAAVVDPVWLLPGFVPAHGTGMLYGASGSYKSFLALDMASCVAHGHAGQWGAPPVPNDVLYLAGEGPISTAKQRRPAWVEWQEVKSPHRLAIFPRVPFMGDKDGWQGLKLDIEEMGMKPRLIIIDTLTRLLTGFDENSTKDASLATGFMEDLARHYECFVLAIHHTGKDESKGARGSSAFFANMDTVLSTKKKPGGTCFQVRKHKDADAPDDPLYFKTRLIGKSLVLERTAETLEDAPRKGMKISWSDPAEIIKVLARNGGRLSNPILALEISSEHHIDKVKVAKELKNRQGLEFLKDGDFWVLPTVQEFDL